MNTTVSMKDSDPSFGCPSMGSRWWDTCGNSKILEVIHLGSVYEICQRTDEAIKLSTKLNVWFNIGYFQSVIIP